MKDFMIHYVYDFSSDEYGLGCFFLAFAWPT